MTKRLKMEEEREVKKTERNKPQRKRKEGFLFYLSIYLFEREGEQGRHLNINVFHFMPLDSTSFAHSLLVWVS